MPGRYPRTRAEIIEAARRAGWIAGGPAPYLHSLPPLIDPLLGHNGVMAPRPGDGDYTGPLAVATHGLNSLAQAILDEHWSNVGFTEGPGPNENPWSVEQWGGWAAYCNSGSCMVPYHHGLRWNPDSQWGEKGFSYTPYHVEQGVALGEFRYDHTSLGDPADVQPLDQLFWAWNGGMIPDHVSTAVEARIGSGRLHGIDYNTGGPDGEGCWETWRDASMFLGRLRPSFYGAAPEPGPPPPPPPDPYNQEGRTMVRLAPAA